MLWNQSSALLDLLRPYQHYRRTRRYRRRHSPNTLVAYCARNKTGNRLTIHLYQDYMKALGITEGDVIYAEFMNPNNKPHCYLMITSDASMLNGSPRARKVSFAGYKGNPHVRFTIAAPSFMLNKEWKFPLYKHDADEKTFLINRVMVSLESK